MSLLNPNRIIKSTALYYMVLFAQYAFLTGLLITITFIVADLRQGSPLHHSFIQNLKACGIFAVLFFIARNCLTHYFQNRRFIFPKERKHED